MQQAALLAGAKLERSSDKGLEQRVSAVGTALELRMELCAQMEVTAGQLHSLHQTTVRAGAGNDKTGILHFLTEFVVELVAVAVALDVYKRQVLHKIECFICNFLNFHPVIPGKYHKTYYP